MSIKLSRSDEDKLERGLYFIEIPDGATHILVVDSRLISKALLESLDMCEKGVHQPVVVFGKISVKDAKVYQYMGGERA